MQKTLKTIKFSSLLQYLPLYKAGHWNTVNNFVFCRY